MAPWAPWIPFLRCFLQNKMNVFGISNPITMTLAHSSLVYYRNNNTRHSLAQWVSDMSLVAKMSAGLATRKKSKITRSLRSLVIFLIFYLCLGTHFSHEWHIRHELCQRMTSVIISIIHECWVQRDFQTRIVPTNDECYYFYNTRVLSALITL